MEWVKLLNPTRPEGTSQKKPDHREQFERDYDRTVFSAPVRRLQDKTQVFPLDPNDSVRTRLTHSLEVSTLARGLARSVTIKLKEKGKINGNMDRQIEAIAATCGLLHDLGNPPFGHAGEYAIQHWFEEHFSKDPSLKPLSSDSQFTQDFLHFQGNAQTIRLITKLQILAGRGGLNLTYGTLSAALKYVSASNEIDSKRGHIFSKLGYFTSENEIVEKIRSETGTGVCRNPITFLVEAADDLAYSVVDLEDGISKGILGWRALKEMLKAKLGRDNVKLYDKVIEETNRVLRIKQKTKFHKQVYSDQSYARAFRTAVIGMAVAATTEKFIAEHDNIMGGKYYEEIVYDTPVGILIKSCKEIGFESVYCTDENLKLELMGRHIITGLLSIFWEGVRIFGSDSKEKFPNKLCALLSDNYKTVFSDARNGQKHIPIEYLRLQLVVDYVCGMTDSFALNLHRDLRNG